MNLIQVTLCFNVVVFLVIYDRLYLGHHVWMTLLVIAAVAVIIGNGSNDYYNSAYHLQIRLLLFADVFYQTRGIKVSR